MTQLDESHDLLHAENKDRIYQHNKILDKLEQRIAKLEKVLESHAKCIGELRGTELRIHDLKEIKNEQL
jgi:hypothetical protein